MDTQNKTHQTSGHFTMQDENNSPIALDWVKIDVTTAQLTEKVKAVSQLLTSAYTEVELMFAQTKTEEIPSDQFLQSLAPLITSGYNKIDWDLVRVEIKTLLNKFFTTMDWSLFSNPKDSYFFITAKEGISNKPIGVMQCILSPERPGSVKIELYNGICINKDYPNLQSILLSTIYKLFPDTQRIFFHTRVTNVHGIIAHEALQFSTFPSDLANWTNLEYITGKNSVLQKFSLLLN